MAGFPAAPAATASWPAIRSKVRGSVFPKAAGTRMACPAGLMAQEQRFLAALDEVTRVETAAQGAVILAGDKGELFRLVPLR